MLIQYTLSDLQKRSDNIKTTLRRITTHPFKPTQCQSLLAQLYGAKNWQMITGNLKKKQPLEINLTLDILTSGAQFCAAWIKDSGVPLTLDKAKELVFIVLPKAYGFKDMETLINAVSNETRRTYKAKKYANPDEHLLQNVSLSQFEKSVPVFARITIDECSSICDFFGVDLAHIPLLDDDFEAKLHQLYNSRGFPNAEGHLSWNGGVIPADTERGQKHILWQRSFFGKYLGPGVFFFNLGSVIDLSLKGVVDKHDHSMLISKLVGTRLAFDHSKATASVLGVVAHTVLAKANIVRQDLQKDILQQALSDSKNGYIFSQHVASLINNYLTKTNLPEKIDPQSVLGHLNDDLEWLRQQLLDVALDNVDYDNDVMEKIIDELNVVMGGISKNERKSFKRDFVESIRRRDNFKSIKEMMVDDFKS